MPPKPFADALLAAMQPPAAGGTPGAPGAQPQGLLSDMTKLALVSRAAADPGATALWQAAAKAPAPETLRPKKREERDAFSRMSGLLG